jgi:glycosyltransferase involved in cell wall biosynthesis
MIAPEPFFEPRGTPISVYQRLKALSALAHEVDLVTYHVGDDVDVAGLTIYRSLNIPFIKHVKIGPSWIKPVLDLLLFFTAFRLLLRNRYDVIHSHEEAAFFAMFLSGLFGTPHLYDMHSSLPKQLKSFQFGNWPWLVKIFTLLERQVLNTCAAVITVGSDLANYIREINPDLKSINIDNVALHINEKPVDRHTLDELKTTLKADNGQLIVYTGSFEPYQGLDLLIDSARSVTEKYPEALFVLVGGKPEQVEELSSKVGEMNLQRSIIFVGNVKPEKALAYLDLADVLVSLRTNGTTIPLKIYSYLHAGKAIVATNVEAHTQVLNNQVAMLVEPTSEAIAEGIKACLGQGDHRKVLAIQAAELARKHYSYTNYLARVEQAYSYLQPQLSKNGRLVEPME